LLQYYLNISVQALSSFSHIVERFLVPAAAVATIIGVCYLVYRLLNAPRFIVGVLPSAEEMRAKSIKGEGDLWIPSFLTEAVFQGKYLAKEVKKEQDVSSPEFKNDECRCREISLTEDRIFELHIIVQNTGKRSAENFTLLTIFDNPEVQLLDVAAEPPILVDALYVQNAEKFKGHSNLVYLIPSGPIRDKYGAIGLPRTWVRFRWRSLPSLAFDMLYLRVEVPKGIESFTMLYKAECPTAFAKCAIYAQLIKLRVSNEAHSG